MNEASADGRSMEPVLEEVAPGVYSYVQPDGTWFINNTGFVVGSESVISIDATSTQRRTQAYLDAIASVTDLPINVLVNTHHHADHTNGNCMFADATIVSHRSCREVMLASGLADYSAVFPGVEWGDLEFRAPDLTFEDRLSLHTGGSGIAQANGQSGGASAGNGVGSVELVSVGFVAHTEGDVIAWVPERGVLFAGDLIFHGGTPFALFGSIQGTLDALDLVQSFGAEAIVPGHGPTFKGNEVPKVLDEQRDYLRFVQAAAQEGLATGRSPLEQAQATDLGDFAKLTDSERLAGNMHVAYGEAQEGGSSKETGNNLIAQDFIAQGIADMVAYNDGKLPRCVA